MSRAALAFAALLSLGGALDAQSVSSPAGFTFIEGNWFMAQFYTSMRHQQFDYTHAGNPLLIQGIAFRRNGPIVAPNTAPKTLDMRVRLDEIDMAVLHREFETNLQNPTITFPRQTISFPDWQPDVGAPAPFDFVVPFDTPFQYTGAQALVIDYDYIHVSNDQAGLADATRVPVHTSKQIFLGGGCAHTSGGPSGAPFLTFLLENSGIHATSYGMRFITRLYNAIGSAPALLFLGLTDPNVSAPGLCGTIHSDPIATIFLGDTDPWGFIDYRYHSFPFVGPFIGIPLYGQVYQHDPNSTWDIPVMMSGATAGVMPPSPWMSPECAWHTAETFGNPDEACDDIHFGGGIVIELRL